MFQVALFLCDGIVEEGIKGPIRDVAQQAIKVNYIPRRSKKAQESHFPCLALFWATACKHAPLVLLHVFVLFICVINIETVNMSTTTVIEPGV